jgi:hypothetical protein
MSNRPSRRIVPSQPPPADEGMDDVDLDHLSEEQRMQLAIIAIRAGRMSQNKAAPYYRVHRGTLQNRFKGMLTRTEAHAPRRKLSESHEAVLTSWIKVQCY